MQICIFKWFYQFYRKPWNIKKISVRNKYILFVKYLYCKKGPGLVHFIYTYRSTDTWKCRADPPSYPNLGRLMIRPGFCFVIAVFSSPLGISPEAQLHIGDHISHGFQRPASINFDVHSSSLTFMSLSSCAVHFCIALK